MGLADFIIKIGVDGRQGVAGIDAVGKRLKGIQSQLSNFNTISGGIGGGILGGAVGGAASIVGGLASAHPIIAAAAVGFSALAGSIGVFLRTASKANALGDLADKLDTTVASIQQLQFAAKAVGEDFTRLVDWIGKLARSQSEALLGNEKMVDSFKRMGVSMKDIKNLSAEELFYKISQSVKDGKLNAANFASFINILGKNAKEAIPAMKDDVAALAQSFKDLGLTINTSALQQLDAFDVAWKKVKATIGAAVTFGTNYIATGMLSLGKLATGVYAAAVGNKPLLDETMTDRELINDQDYSDSLDLTAKLEKKLKDKQGIKKESEKQLSDASTQLLKDRLSSAGSGGGGSQFKADSLARIGGIRGGQDFAGISVQKETNAILKDVRTILRNIRNDNQTE